MARFKSLLSFLLVVLVLLAGCKGEDDKNKVDKSLPPRLQEIQRTGKLVVGTALTVPFEYYEAESNKLVGFDVDVANKIADRLDVTVEWKVMAFADLLTELSTGEIDMVIAAMYIKPEREEIADFTQSYLETGLVMVIRTDDTSIIDFASLAGKTIGVKLGSTGEKWADQLRNEQGIDVTVQRYETTPGSLDELSNGWVDVVFNDRNNSLDYIKTHSNLRIQGEIFDPAGLGIAVKTDDADLLNFINTALTDFKQSGDLDRLFDKWINPETAG